MVNKEEQPAHILSGVVQLMTLSEYEDSLT